MPDLLWLCSLVADDGVKGMYLASQTLDVIDRTLEELGVAAQSYGRLTQFEALPLETRAPILKALEESGLYETAFTEGFANVMSLYPDAPGDWLFDPWRRRGLEADTEVAQRYLAPIIMKCFHGQDLVPTRVKFLFLRGLLKAGHLRFPTGMEDTLEPLTRYPDRISEEERRQVEPFLRSTFLVSYHNDELPEFEVGAQWCRTFWRANWRIYGCIGPETSASSASTPPDRATVIAVFDIFRETVRDLRLRFEDVARRVDPDLYEPDRYEVLSGIAARVIRLVDGAAGAPLMWSSEFGSSLLRSVVEAKIVLRWLAVKDDDTLYSQFKDYGRGKLKLLKLHMEEYVDRLDEAPDHLTKYLEQLELEVNADLWEEFQDISVEPTFSGRSMRNMAIEAGLKSDYDLVFSPASGKAHGDWTTLDRYSLTRCLNPLHLWHRIPDFGTNPIADPIDMEGVLAMAEEVVDEYITAIEPISR